MKTDLESNTKGKLEKIADCVVFPPLTFVTEFMQNSYRANAKNLDIFIDDEKIVFKDDGTGLKDIKAITTLDYSAWDTTDEGFGIGFWSWMAFPYAVDCIIESRGNRISMNKEEILNSDKPRVDADKCTCAQKGFKVTINCSLSDRHDIMEKLKENVYRIGKTQPYNVTLNGQLIEKVDLFAQVDSEYTKDFHNSLFDARLGVSKDTYYSPQCYYEKREVCGLYDFRCVTGVVELRKKALNLKEPDRQDIIGDDKYSTFTDRLNECIVSLYRDFIKDKTSMMDDYSDTISRVLKPRDYERYLNLKDILIDYKEEERDGSDLDNLEAQSKSIEDLKNYVAKLRKDRQISLFEENLTDADKDNINNLLNAASGQKWFNTGGVCEDARKWYNGDVNLENLSAYSELLIGGQVWEKVSEEEDKDDYLVDDLEYKTNLNIPVPVKSKKKKNIVEVINSSKNKSVWLKARDIDDKEEQKQRIEYCGVKILISKNSMYEKVFEEHGIPYLDDVAIEETYSRKNVALNTDKERLFIRLLNPLCKYFEISEDTFTIGNIEMTVEVKINKRVINRETRKNTKYDINVNAVTDYEAGKIIFDRRALNLARFNLNYNYGFGKNELKAIFATSDTVAHELAHYLYHTEDNTMEHYIKQEMLKNEIKKIYIAM